MYGLYSHDLYSKDTQTTNVDGGGRAAVRMLSQALAREFSPKGIHVVHTIANGGIRDEDGEDQASGKKMSAEAVRLVLSCALIPADNALCSRSEKLMFI